MRFAEDLLADITITGKRLKYAAFVLMGHITPALCFTLESEHGASVKAANFKYDGIAGGLVWSGKRRNDALPAEMKKRWVFYCK